MDLVERFYAACQTGDHAEVKRILRGHPDFDVNQAPESSWRPLQVACRNGHQAVVSLLLSQASIDVNQKTSTGMTSFHAACARGKTDCARLLLGDPRMESVNEVDIFGFTPLCTASFKGHFELVRWMVASGRALDLGDPSNDRTDAVGAARLRKHGELVSLLERFKVDPVKTKQEVWLELGCHGELAAALFALVVFTSDGLLEITKAMATMAPAARFLAIATCLPVELQMVLCYRIMGSPKDLIMSRDSEAAFRELAWTLSAQ